MNENKKNTKEQIFTIPENYRELSSAENYLKLKQGENKIRIMSSMVMGWEDWTDEEKPKPVRFRYEERPDAPIKAGRPIKQFWAFVVWNYSENKLQILHVTQASIRKSISRIVNDVDWGNAVKYDLKISRSGQELNTVYAVIPCKPTPIPAKAKQAYEETEINLDALFDNGDPFANSNIVSFEAFTPKKVKKAV